MSNFYVMEAVNLFCGDHDPTNSKHLTLASLTLPTLEEATADHQPGGSVAALQIGMGVINALEVSFKLNGYDPDMMSMFGLGKRQRHVYTAYGLVRDKRTSAAIEAKAIFHARLGRLEPDEFSRGELMGHKHGLIEIMHYESYFAGKEKHYFDFFTQAWRVDGVSQNADERRILRIPGVA